MLEEELVRSHDVQSHTGFHFGDLLRNRVNDFLSRHLAMWELFLLDQLTSCLLNVCFTNDSELCEHYENHLVFVF